MWLRGKRPGGHAGIDEADGAATTSGGAALTGFSDPDLRPRKGHATAAPSMDVSPTAIEPKPGTGCAIM